MKSSKLGNLRKIFSVVSYKLQEGVIRLYIQKPLKSIIEFFK